MQFYSLTTRYSSVFKGYPSCKKLWIVFVICLLVFPVTGVWAGDEKKCLPVQQVFLPSGQVVTVAEGDGEPRSLGSYSVRLYAGKKKEYPLDDFLAGTVRPRDGVIEKVVVIEVEQEGNPDFIVVMRSAGSGSYLSADAFTVFGNTIQLVETASGLGPEEDPVRQLVGIMKKKSETSSEAKDSTCLNRQYGETKTLPAEEEIVTLSNIRKICLDNGLDDLWAKIKKNPPKKPFQSDGCSLWFKTWKGVSLYPACFFHDLKYWAGYPGEDVARLIADAELMIDVACLLDSIGMAETMFQGVRRGGHEIYQQSFSWGFGRVLKEDSLPDL